MDLGTLQWRDNGVEFLDTNGDLFAEERFKVIPALEGGTQNLQLLVPRENGDGTRILGNPSDALS